MTFAHAPASGYARAYKANTRWSRSMPAQIRGADIVARTLDAAGLTTIFTLSGNHIMPLFDAAIGTRLQLIHVRHEAAAVHMADAWGRLTGQCGIVWVSGGAGLHQRGGGAVHGASRRVAAGAALGPRGLKESAAAPSRSCARRRWRRRSPKPRGSRARRRRWAPSWRRRCASRVRPARSGASEPAVRPAGGAVEDDARALARRAAFCAEDRSR